MKVIDVEVPPYEESEVFTAMRSKVDYIRTVMSASKQLLLNRSPTVTSTCKLRLLVDKMSRIFIYKDGKFFSLAFPFTVSLLPDGKGIEEIRTYSGRDINSGSISSVLAIINDEKFLVNSSALEFYSEASFPDLSAINLLEEILLTEPGYIRYDFDSDRVNGKLHPLHHLDVNYSQYGTYKVGLNNAIDAAFFEDVMNINTDCSFLSR